MSENNLNIVVTYNSQNNITFTRGLLGLKFGSNINNMLIITRIRYAGFLDLIQGLIGHMSVAIMVI